MLRHLLTLAAAFASAAPAIAQEAVPAAQDTAAGIAVTLSPELGEHRSGRLLVFAQRVEPGAEPQDAVDTSPFNPTGTAIAAREISDLSPGAPALVGASTDSFPTSFTDLPSGTYRFQAVLDRNHDYNYGGRGAGDYVSPVVEATLPGPMPALTLSRELPATGLADWLARMPEAERAKMEARLAALEPVDFESSALTAFWGRATHIRGWIALPPGYDPDAAATYPTVYSTGGFGSTLDSARLRAAQMAGMMAEGETPPMIWVYLDESSPTGTHEFADSVNNGPWGHALTEELIPALESEYRMDARPNGRFLTGHSSGGWATLWLQVRYPEIFGGTWPTAPDPSDFHDFTNIDLYADGANAYVGDDGEPLPLVRNQGEVVATLRQFGEMEAALGAYGGQFASFEWVFSPKGPDGRPMPLFDRATGEIDPMVARYWIENYDIAHRVRRDWAEIGPALTGKIHLIVGTADTFYLDGPARRLEAVLDELGAEADFRFLPGKTHFDLFARDGDSQALLKDIAREMYAVARPGEDR
ncbi:alpha/beta hydrolase [Stakelama tenebrarum]|uniref:Esterase family protein n=1 Tax=Stakelama tenebrarum TaxID=2711215 RepID=A0A6G6Y3S4_9SPHN|nr:alpha/beta hydrolase-fold protein [Sphingosinithalassobacter tenebrarum]QIG79263.1 esterase family protein [Sphingosinithalassobacter tenebrarum]